MNEPMEQQIEMTVGLRLQKARLEKGFSQLEVAERLFLTVQIIEHLDNDAYHLIQKRAFVRGYIRAYARVVGLDGGELVASYEKEVGAEEPVNQEPTMLMNAEDPSLTKNPIFRAGAVGLAVLIVVVMLVWVIMSGESEPSSPPVANPSRAEGTPSVLSAPVASGPVMAEDAESPPQELASDEEPSAESPESQVQSAAMAESPMITESPTPTDSSEKRDLETEGDANPASFSAAEGRGEEPQTMTDVQEEVGSSSRKSTSEGASEAARLRSALGAKDTELAPQVFRSVTARGRFIQVIVDGADAVQITTEESCWVEVADAQGNLLYGDLNQAGDELEVIGTAPFQILLGKASASSLRFNGQLIDLEPHTTREYTARLTLGEGQDAR